MEHQHIGTRNPRVDALDKVTGRAIYAADLNQPGMLHGSILRSTRPHARIRHIETSRARSLPGVKAVVTGMDAPDVRYTMHYIFDQRLLARNKVRYIGEPVAAVAAVDPAVAEEALELIEVDYEDLPAVFDPLEAMKPDAPVIHEDLARYPAKFAAVKYGNVCSYTQIHRGDVEEGLRRADLVVENTFTTARIHQAYIEPHACLANVDSSGRVTVWTTSQAPFKARNAVCQTLQLPMSKVRVIATEVGGGFGGKESLLDGIAALLSLHAGRPVKMVLSRWEEFVAGRPRQPTRITLRTGAKKDGTLTAVKAQYVYDSGAYADQSPGTTAYGATFAKGPYRVDNVHVDAYCVYTNNVISGACRGYGGPPQCWATESQMDIIADELGMDPFELRLINGVNEGDQLTTGQVCRNVSMKATLRAAAERAGWQEKRKANAPYRGIGLACHERGFGLFSSGVVIKLNEDGTYSLLSGAVEIGTGAKTVLSQIAAEELGVGVESISVIMADTDATPYDYGSVASRTTYTSGNAIRLAAADVRRQLFELAAGKLEVGPAELELRAGVVSVRLAPEQSVPVAALAGEAIRRWGGPIIGRGSYLAEGTPLEPGTVSGYPMGPFPGLVYNTQVAEVEVDPATGQVRVLKLYCAQDVGKAINQAGVEGQVYGGLAQGLGFAVMENLISQDGRVVNPTFLDYKIPTAVDVPQAEMILVEVPDDKGPYGAKGIGEALVGPTAPAIANAIFHATGARIRDLPITAERVLLALQTKGK
jgi:carbon-monoxide dehydrogenase large subunit